MKRAAHRTLRMVIESYDREPGVFMIRAISVLFIVISVVFIRSFWAPDTLLILLLLIGLVFGKVRAFAGRFVPFLGLLYVYDSMRSIAPQLNTRVNWWPMIDADRWLGGGQIVSSRLQQLLWHGHVQWYDFYFYVLYTLHFLTPVIIGLILWRWRPKLYWPFVWAIISASFLAFLVYVAFPAAPPWMAADAQYVTEPFRHISGDIWAAVGLTNFSVLYPQLSPNPVAAVPSLHSAYPMIAAIFLIYAFGWRRAWWTILYPLSMWVGVVYLGEHYVVDIIAAWIDVAVAFGIVYGAYYFKRRNKLLAKTRQKVDTGGDDRRTKQK